MSSIQETYEIGQIMKLIDLNGDVTNFEIDFQVSAADNAEFYMAIIDQNTLDEGNLEYKNIKSIVSGNIRNDKNQYNSYMMALKADKPCNISVNTDFKPLPDNIPEPEPPEPQEPQEPPPPVKKSGISWKYILIGIIAVAGLCLLYYFYFYGDSGSKPNDLNSNEGLSKDFNQESLRTMVPGSSWESNNTPEPGSSWESNNDMGSYDVFEKLRNLPLK